tara:strand:+ start:354 stop:782 length:429 start_codon:yes stop_codon:yes gene_type:complete
MMRSFDIRCHNHGDMYDVMLDAPTGRIKAIELNEWQPRCPLCDHPVTIIVPPVLTVGPMDSKPIDLTKSVGRKFTSNAQWREYQKRNPNARPVSVTDQSWKDHYNQVRELADQRAIKQGYACWGDKKERRKKEKIAAGELKP